MDFFTKDQLLINLYKKDDNDFLNFVKSKDIEKLGYKIDDTKDIVKNMYKYFNKKSNITDINEFTSFFDSCNRNLNIFFIILMHPRLNNSKKTKYVEILLSDSVLKNGDLLIVILKYVKNFGDSYQKGNFPFGIKDQFPVIKQVGGRKSSKN